MLNDVGPPSVNGKTINVDHHRHQQRRPERASRSRSTGTHRGRSAPAVRDAFAFQTDVHTPEFDQDVSISVRAARRLAGRPRRGPVQHARDRSGPPPPPTIGISRGASCTRRRRGADEQLLERPPELAVRRASCAFANLSITFAPDAQNGHLALRVRQFPSARRDGSGDFNEQVRPYYQLRGVRSPATCRFSFNYGRTSASSARSPSRRHRPRAPHSPRATNEEHA